MNIKKIYLFSELIDDGVQISVTLEPNETNVKVNYGQYFKLKCSGQASNNGTTLNIAIHKDGVC
jgi:hypothetical protein